MADYSGPETVLSGIAEEIVEDIIRELSGRSGLRQAWDGIDPETQDEIIRSWRIVVKNTIRRVVNG